MPLHTTINGTYYVPLLRFNLPYFRKIKLMTMVHFSFRTMQHLTTTVMRKVFCTSGLERCWHTLLIPRTYLHVITCLFAQAMDPLWECNNIMRKAATAS
jgi:hypothetical protein